MNCLQLCVDQCKMRIPRRILEEVFVRRYQKWRGAPLSIDQAIRANVILPRVFVDLTLHGGTEVWVPLENVPYERTDDYTSVYRIPKSLTQNRSIVAALNVTFTDPLRANSYGITAGCGNSTMMQAAQAVMDAHAQIPITSTAKVQLIGENVVMVRDSMILPPNIYLRCVVGYDENLNDIQQRAIPYIAKLCEYAVKAYIYNEMVIEIDIGEIQGGQVIGQIKNIVDSYSDMQQMYDDYLTNTVQKVLFMNDQESFNRLIKLITGGMR